MSGRGVTTLDLMVEEQEHVRAALHFLKVKLGTCKSLAKVLHFEETTLLNAWNAKRTVTANMAFRIAPLVGVGVGIDDLLAGKWLEANTCPRRGYQDTRKEEARKVKR